MAIVPIIDMSNAELVYLICKRLHLFTAALGRINKLCHMTDIYALSYTLFCTRDNALPGTDVSTIKYSDNYKIECLHKSTYTCH